MQVAHPPWHAEVLRCLRQLSDMLKAIEKGDPSDRQLSQFLVGDKVRELDPLAGNPPDHLQSSEMMGLHCLRRLCRELPTTPGETAGTFGYDLSHLNEYVTTLASGGGTDRIQNIIDLLSIIETPADSQASVSAPGGPVESIERFAPSPPTKKTKRRGRVAGVNKINEALGELNSRLKDGRPTTIVALAKAVGCDTDNLKNSRRFMTNYREVTDGMKRVIRHEGSKKDGELEAWAAGSLRNSENDCDPEGYCAPDADVSVPIRDGLVSRRRRPGS